MSAEGDEHGVPQREGSEEGNATAPGGTASARAPGSGADLPGEQKWQVPWPEGIRAESWSPERAQLAMAFAAAVRRTGSLFVLMTHAAADRIGVNATDLNCMNILSFSGQMTAGELAKATGLTTASITGVVDRLEQAGFVRRERDPDDRRRVVVQMDVERAFGKIMPVFGPMMGAWRRMADTYTDDELRLIVGYYGQMEQILREHLAKLRDGAE
jgi:DNA-binding transcriptional ArsR family regulator